MTTITATIFNTMKQFLDESSKKANYMVQELKSNGLSYNSYFNSKKKALTYAKHICDEDSTIYIYKSYCMKIYDPVNDMSDEMDVEINDTNYNPETDLSNMTLWSYGKGYLLEPPEDSDYYGHKYFHNGWWMESQNAWFFKKEDYQWLIDCGAVKATDEDGEHEDGEHEEHEEHDEVDLSNMTLWSYGKGWLLEPLKDDEHYGEKYFHEGWWMPKQNGWFFKDEHYQWLIDHGVIISTDDDVEATELETTNVSETDVDLSSMKLTSYGKGWLLKPTIIDEHYGEKYFHEGWWMPKQNGWFFKDEHYQWLLEQGVNISKMMTSKTCKTSKMCKTDTMDLSKMSLEEYGKGYILKTTKKDKLYGEKYLMDGFWNKGQKGWFFKEHYFDHLISMGAKYIKTEDEENILSNSTELSSSITNDSFEYVYDDSEFMTNENMAVPKFIKYGKGWVLKSDSNYKYSKGLDYFEGGWWIPSIKGWFFKTEQKKKFMQKHFEI